MNASLPHDLAIPPLPDEASPGWLRRSWRTILWVSALTFVCLVAWLAFTAPLGRALEPSKTPSLVLLAADGTPIARRGDYKEAPVNVAELPRYVPAALIAIEDRRFYSHWGIDPRGIARAMFANVQAGSLRQGGSTLTQQLAKTSFLSSDRSLKRKLQEVIIAFWLEAWLTKDEILSRHMSSVYFGDGAYGLRAASRTYFNRAPDDLTVGQAAMLAGLMVAPSALAPSRHLGRARARQRLVLAAMVETGALTADQARNVAPARYRPGRQSIPTGSYFADWVLPQARAVGDPSHYGERQIATTLDPELQRDAERFVREALRSGRSANIGQAALVAMRPDGQVVAMVGGGDYAATRFNRATQAERQPGSAFKLFVYSAAMRAGLSPGSSIEDTPLIIGDYAPKNDEGKYRGTISLATAFAASSNVAAVRLAQEIGTERVIAEARRLGVKSPLTDQPSLALGTSAMTLVELTQAYAAVAAGRYPVRAHGLAEPGRRNWRETLSQTVAAVRPWPGHDDTIDLLRSAVRNGTGRAANLPVATYGKTGTTQNYRDAWFVGFAGDLVVGVWMGNDDDTPMRGVSGSGAPARLWKRFMTSALRRDGALRAPQREAVVAEAPVIEAPIAGPDLDAMREAARAMEGTIEDATDGDGSFDIERAVEAARRVEEASRRPEETPAQQ